MPIFNAGALNVRGGSVHIGTSAAVAPTSATAPLAQTWTTLGRYGQDGLTESRSRSTTQTKDQWGETVFEVVTESGLTYEATFLETVAPVLEQFYASTVSDTGEQVIVPGLMAKRAPFVIDAVLEDANGARWIERHYVPVGQTVETGDRNRKQGDVAGYKLKIRAYPSSTITDTASGQAGSSKIFRSAVSAS